LETVVWPPGRSSGTGMASYAGTKPRLPTAFSRASTAWFRRPKPRSGATAPPAT